MLGETENLFSLTRAALSTIGRAKSKFLPVVEARLSVRDRLRNEGMEEKLGGIKRLTSVADAVEAFQKQTT